MTKPNKNRLLPKKNKEKKDKKKWAEPGDFKERPAPKNISRCPLVSSMLNHPMGAYAWHKKYDSSIIPYIPELYIGGRTNVQVAIDIGICETTFYQWIKDYPEFAEAVKIGNSIAKADMMDYGLDAVKGDRKVNDKIWHIIMRNVHHFDEKEDGVDAFDQVTNLVERLKHVKSKDY